MAPAKSKKSSKPAPKKQTTAKTKKQPAKAVKPFRILSFTPSASNLSARFQAAVDKREIADRIYDFCRGLDRMDENLLRSTCHMDATVDLGPGIFQGLFSDYLSWAFDVLSQTRVSQHLVGNTRIEIEGDTAYAESYVQTYFRMDKATGREDLFIGSRFLDRLERRPAGTSGAWKIVHHKQVLDWTRTEAASEVFYHQNPDALWSNRAKKDPSYAMDSFPGAQNGSKAPSFLGRRYDSKSIKM
jgi:hypothetical protein